MGLTGCLCHGESIASLTCQMPIKPHHTIPTVAQKAVDGAEENHQSNYPHQGAWKANLTSSQAKRVDAFGIKFEDLLNLYLESTTTEAFHTVLKGREASIASHSGEVRESAGALPLDVRSAGCLCLLQLPYPPPKKPPNCN